MTGLRIHGADRRRPLSVGEDVKRITDLAHELQRNAVELAGHSHKLRDTLDALNAANVELDLQAREISLAQGTADAATARLARLQSITAALSNTVTPDGVADSVLHEAMIALECDAAAIVVLATEATGSGLMLLRESGSLDPLMRSFTHMNGYGNLGPYAEAIESHNSIYLESVERAVARYPAFSADDLGSHGAWIFLPLEIGGHAAGTLAFGFSSARSFSSLDRHFADTVARYGAQALDRVRLRVAAASAITEAKDARALAEAANSAKTLFLRGMSHELCTPLNAISGYAALLEDEVRGPVNADQAKDLNRIRRASAYLLRLINDILTVARLEGARPMHLTSVSVNSVLAEVDVLCAIQARARGLNLTVSPSSPPIVVVADAERMQQVLLNLVTNAIKFTPAGGSVTVTCATSATVATLDVTDSGIGIRPADIARVFEPFVQIDPHLTSPTHQGVGLGLSISRELARGMGGDLNARSVEGSGSTFSLTLPFVPSTLHPEVARA
jgi:signal transduction histidine kinase